MDCDPRPSKKVKYGDPDFESTLLEWAEEVGSENSDNESDGDYIPTDHDSESEIELSEEENMENTDEAGNSQSVFDGDYLYGKNRHKWSRVSPVPKNTRTLQHNIVLKCPGLKRKDIHSADPQQVWNLLLSDNILDVIVKFTNTRLSKMRQKYKNQTNTDLRDLDLMELKAFLGLLIFSSIFKSSHEDIRSIFATDGSGRNIFRCVINANRFSIILSSLRFDAAETREQRKRLDPLAAISEVFDTFIFNCQKVYTIGAYACIDEMLVSFRGRCKFKMFMPAKPCKYGLKVMAMTDARTGYLFNAYIYSGKDSDGYLLSDEEKTFSKPTQAVVKLAKPIYNTNRNITADNWFSSMELVNFLKTKKLTFVGTLKKNKGEIPPTFLPNSKREVGSSLYGFTSDTTILSFVPKKNRAVLLLSSMHHNKSVDCDTGKPEMIEFYNLTKGGVDSLDQKCSVYSSSRRTSRWPMAIFFRIVDIASINSYILHQSYRDNPKVDRYQFGKELAYLLVTPHMKRRYQNVNIGREIKLCIKRILKLEEPQHLMEGDKLQTRTTCRRCPSKKERKTFHVCVMCKTPICMECTKRYCKECST